MHWSRRQVLVLGIVAGGAVAGFVGQMLWHQALRAEIKELRIANRSLAVLRVENLALRRRAAELAQLRSDDAELTSLRVEALALQTKIEAAALLPPPHSMPIPQPTMPRLDRRIVIGAIGSPAVKTRGTPTYPRHLRTTGIGGVVDVALTIDREGNVADSWVVNTTRPEFGWSVLEAIQGWKYQPAPKAEESPEVTIVVPITFDPQKGRVSIGRAEPVQVPAARPARALEPDWF